MNPFLDTSILVDNLRGYSPAVEWLKAQLGHFCIAPVTWMEVIDGVTNRIEQERAAKIMRQFELIHLNDQDMLWAMDMHMKFRLSHGIDMIDCLIAAPCARLNIPLYTRNLKHFTPLLNALAIQPY